jgi:hypothetical protein
MYIIFQKEYNTMSTEMQHVDPFGLPDDFEDSFEQEVETLSYDDYDHDLHDNYDLLSQPLKHDNFRFNVGEKNEHN